jgi:hypothetical protein
VLPYGRATLALSVLYLAIALPLAWRTHNILNPDDVAYLRIAGYYAHGRWDLAVASWWGPLISWILAPFARTDLDVTLVGRGINLVLGWLFACGVRALARTWFDTGSGPPGPRGAEPAERAGLLAFAIGLVLALNMFPQMIGPDLLLSTALTWYFVWVSRAIATGARRAWAVAGVLGGVAYLSKGFALPFVAAHLPLSIAFAAFAARSERRRLALAGPVVAVTAWLAIAAPWVAVISAHEGRFTISAAGAYADAFADVPATKGQPLPIFSPHEPRPGRISSWESPTEIPGPWPRWSRFAGAAGLKNTAAMLRAHAADTLAILWSIDLGLSLAALTITIAVPPVRRSSDVPPGGRGLAGVFRLWACLSAVLYIGGYQLVLVAPRFFWPVSGLLACLTIAVFVRLCALERCAAGRAAGEQGPAPVTKWVAALLLAATAACAAPRIGGYFLPEGRHARFNFVREVAARLGPGGPIAVSEWHNGIVAAYFSGRPLVGEFKPGTPPNAPAEWLAALPGARFIVFDDPGFASALVASGRFAQEWSGSNPRGRHSAVILRPQP